MTSVQKISEKKDFLRGGQEEKSKREETDCDTTKRLFQKGKQEKEGKTPSMTGKKITWKDAGTRKKG